MYKVRLKELREDNKLLQKEVAKIINIYKGVYNQYETEYLIIPIKHLISLCDYFEVSLDYIFEITDTKIYSDYKKEVDKTLAGKRLKEFRKEYNLTQEKLGTILNTTKTVICGYEKGRFLIATPFLYTICKKYNVSADYLLGKTDIK